MITFEDAMKIAINEKKKWESIDRKVVFTHAKDCRTYWTISFEYEDPDGERYGTCGIKMYFEISKENGEILDNPPQRPWNKYWDIYVHGKNVPIPEKYLD